MSLRDVLTGRRKVKGPAPDRLFALSTAYVDARERARRSRPPGCAGIVFQPLATERLRVDRQGHGGGRPGDRRATVGATVESYDDSLRLPLDGHLATASSRTSWSRSTPSRARSRPAATASGSSAPCSPSPAPAAPQDLLHLQLQARRSGTRSSRRRRTPARRRARAPDQGPGRARAADRARPRALVPALGDSLLSARTAPRPLGPGRRSRGCAAVEVSRRGRPGPRPGMPPSSPPRRPPPEEEPPNRPVSPGTMLVTWPSRPLTALGTATGEGVVPGLPPPRFGRKLPRSDLTNVVTESMIEPARATGPPTVPGRHVAAGLARGARAAERLLEARDERVQLVGQAADDASGAGSAPRPAGTRAATESGRGRPGRRRARWPRPG